MALWGGRFESGPDQLFKDLNDSFPFDYVLAAADITGSMSWARALAKAGVLTGDELSRLLAALDALLVEVRMQNTAYLAAASGKYEDVHSWVESRLIEAVGDLGKKLHTGRSRNDQVATDVRLWLRWEIDERLAELFAARSSLLALAERERETVMSGYTHMQRAQPILFAHWALAYFEMLGRDCERFGDCLNRVNRCPLGSGALAGTGFPIDREALALDLGFASVTRNSLDATADRDFTIEALSAAATCAMHLSRLGEDLILFGTQEFGLVEFHDSVSSGSSLMPQKKNPDACELLRGKCGRIVGSLTAMLVTTKGLPLAYNKDLQEDKEGLFDAMHQLSLCLRVLPKILDTLVVRRDRCRAAAQGGYANATDLADFLVRAGVPFREAHEQSGRAVRLAIAKGCPLEELDLATLQSVAPKATAEIFPALSLERSLAGRDVIGGTGRRAVAAALAEAREQVRPS